MPKNEFDRLFKETEESMSLLANLQKNKERARRSQEYSREIEVLERLKVEEFMYSFAEFVNQNPEGDNQLRDLTESSLISGSPFDVVVKDVARDDELAHRIVVMYDSKHRAVLALSADGSNEWPVPRIQFVKKFRSNMPVHGMMRGGVPLRDEHPYVSLTKDILTLKYALAFDTYECSEPNDLVQRMIWFLTSDRCQIPYSGSRMSRSLLIAADSPDIDVRLIIENAHIYRKFSSVNLT